VLVAQGGTVHGFSLYFKAGELNWAIRRERELQTVSAKAETLANPRKITASLDRDGTMRLTIDGREVGTGKASGLLPKLPTDGLQIGKDLKGAVGDYKGPFPFGGRIESVVVELQEP
jgi:arylsulfatase